MAKKAYVWDGSEWQEITSDTLIPTATTGSTGIVQLVDSVSSTSTTNAATPNSVKDAYDRGSLGVTNAATAQDAAVAAQSTANGKAELSSTAPAAIASTAAVGTGTTSARADHVHVGVPTTRTLTGTAPITVGGVSGTGQALSADLTVAATAATTSAAGVVQLSDSFAANSSVLASTPTALRSAQQNLRNTVSGATVRTTIPIWILQNVTSSITSGQIVLSRYIPESDFTLSNIAMLCLTAGINQTLVKFGVYTRSGTTFTRVAQTASDTTIFNTANAKFTRALSASYAMVGGTEYFIAYISVGATTAPATVAGPGISQTAFLSGGVNRYTVASQTDLAATVTGVAVATQLPVYSELT